MRKFYQDIKKYKHYIQYSIKANLKAEVSDSYLNWLWWILDPLLFMLVYTFVATIVFGKSEPYFPIFVFIGLNAWKFFNSTVTKSVRLIRIYKGTLSKIYTPKYVFVLVTMFVNLFKMAVAFTIVLIMIPCYRVPITYHVIYAIPTFLVLIIITFSLSCLGMHAGVFFADLSNIITVVFKLVFYMSGIFYSIPKRVPSPFSELLLHLNPIALIIDSLRNCLLYGQNPNAQWLLLWSAISIVCGVVGIKLIQKYENTYVKVI